MADLNGAASDLRATFLEVYSKLKSELLSDPAFEWTDGSRLWVERVRFPFVAFLYFFVCVSSELHFNAVSEYIVFIYMDICGFRYWSAACRVVNFPICYLMMELYLFLFFEDRRIK